MKKLIFLVAIAVANIATAQKYFTKTGTTQFKASVEAFEPVEAVNESTTVVLNSEKRTHGSFTFHKGFPF